MGTTTARLGPPAVKALLGWEALLARTNLMTRLLILVAIATLPALVVTATIQNDLRDQGRLRIGEQALRQTDLLNANLANVVEGARILAVAVAHLAPVQAGNPACAASLASLRAELPGYASLTVLDGDGALVCSTDPAAPSVANASARAHLHATIREGRLDVGTFQPATATHGPMLPLSLPFRTGTGQPAVVVAGLSLDWLEGRLAELQSPQGSTIAIADRTGVVLAEYPGAGIGNAIEPALARYLTAPRRGNAVMRGADGIERQAGFVPADTNPLGLFVSVGLGLPDMLADLDRATFRGNMMIAFEALMSLLLALVAGHRFVRRPTEALLKAARSWSSGDLSARAELDETPGTEFGSLARAFNDMAASLDQQRSELQSLNANLEARVDARTHDLHESRNRLQREMIERENTEASLHQAQKLQAVGQLAGGIAHDFNNLLTAIVGALDLLRGRLMNRADRALPERMLQLVDGALQAAERGGKLTGQLLAFSRRQVLMPVPTDLNHTVVAMSDMLAATLGRSIRIRTDLQPDLWPAMVDPSQIEAAILNLAINARDAMPDGGVLCIATRNHPGADAEPAQDFVTLVVTDTGVGMTGDVAARAFEPFFTTKPQGQSSGLGLSQVHGLSVQSGGDARIDSTPGVGTIVTLKLPRSLAAPAIPFQPMALSPTNPRMRVRVLVVDDDRDVRGMTAEMLRDRGHTVMTADCGEAALAMLDEESAFDLLLADYVMPGMNGVQLIEAARALHPLLHVLLMTGHADLVDDGAFQAYTVLRKPFNIATLDHHLLRALGPPRLRVITAD